jgi:hypothetical protein
LACWHVWSVLLLEKNLSNKSILVVAS